MPSNFLIPDTFPYSPVIAPTQTYALILVDRNKDNIPRTCEMQNGEEHTKEKIHTTQKIYVVHNLGYIHRIVEIFHYKIERLQRWHEKHSHKPKP